MVSTAKIALAFPAVLGALALAVAPARAQAPEQSAPIPEGAPPGMANVDREGLKEHATFLASDELGGRYTASTGQIKAAEYIADHFKKLGLLPMGDKRGSKRSFFQKYPVERTHLDPKGTSITIGKEKHTTGFGVIEGKTPGKVKISGAFAYCGDGSPDEFAKGSFKRKIPVVVLAERGGGGRMGGVRTEQRVVQIAKKLADKGARAAVYCLTNTSGGMANALNTYALLPDKPLLRFGSQGRRYKPHRIPSVFLSSKLSAELLKHMGVDTDNGEPASNPKAKGKLEVFVKVDKKYQCLNVAAYLKGSSKSLSADAVVYSAHMDHMGTRLDGDAFNGADDNASGSAGLLELAEAFAKAQTRPKRSVVFLSVSGEELGLWGSKYYSDHSTWPVGRIIANVNIDMIGRVTQLSGAKAVSVTPSYRHNKFSTLVRDAAGFAEQLGMSLTNGDTYYQRSDHYNFAVKGIPVVFFCDGEHADYHQVTDHADKLDFAKMELVARLAYWTGYATADGKGRPRTLGRQSGW